MADNDIPVVPDIPSIIGKWPPEGLELRPARQRMPSYCYKVPVGPATRAQGPRTVFEYVTRTRFQMCEGELRQVLGSGMLVLVGYRIGQPDQPVVVAAARISGLEFDFDRNSVHFDDGLILRGCTIYSAAHWRARPKEPLLIAAAGPLPLFAWSEQHEAKEEGMEKGETPAPSFKFMSNKAWYGWATQNIPPDDWERGWQTRYSKKLEPLLAKAVKGNSKLKASDPHTIHSALTAYGMWPKPPQ